MLVFSEGYAKVRIAGWRERRIVVIRYCDGSGRVGWEPYAHSLRWIS
jgi:hypothetical protein